MGDYKDKVVVVGIMGAAGAGKDTFATLLETAWRVDTEYTGAVLTTPLAEPLKDAVAELLDIPLFEVDEYKRSDAPVVTTERGTCNLRQVLQSLGTEWGREHMGKDFWVRLLDMRLEDRVLRHPGITTPKQGGSPVSLVIIPDVRFEEEAEFVRSFPHHQLVTVVRNGIDGGRHASEQYWKTAPADVKVLNNGMPSEMGVYASVVSRRFHGAS